MATEIFRVAAFERLFVEQAAARSTAASRKVRVHCTGADPASAVTLDVDASWRPVQCLKLLGDGGGDPYVAARITSHGLDAAASGRLIGLADAISCGEEEPSASEFSLSLVPFSSAAGKTVRKACLLCGNRANASAQRLCFVARQ